MNKANIHRHGGNLMRAVACVAIAWFAVTPENISAAGKPAPAQTAQAPGRLVVLRAANIGPQIVNLKIDGVQTAQIYYNRSYDAPLAAGPHVLTVSPVIRSNASSAEMRLTAEPGKTYTFTAAWQDTRIVFK